MTLDKQRKKELAAEYTTSMRSMGVYAIVNQKNGKRYVQSSMDLNGVRNRFEFMKQMNMILHPEIKLDWQKDGAESFVFEELDQIKPSDDIREDPRALKEEVATLLALWLEKLEPYDEQGYNKRDIRNG